MTRLKAGVGVAVITPPVGIEMGGWILGVTAAAVVSLDVAHVSAAITKQVREIVAEQTSIPKANLLLNCSHTHATPFSGWDVPRGEGLSAGHRTYLEAFPHYVAGAIIEAWHKREPAAIGAASTMVPGISINRRNPTLPIDTQLGVIRVDDADGQPLACLVNFACHANVVGAQYIEWTADFPGYLAGAIESAEPGCACLFLQGAEGNIQAWDCYYGNRNPRFPSTYESAERLGNALAGPALGLLHQIETDASAQISVASGVIPLPPRPIKWTAEEAEAFLAELEASVQPYTEETGPEDIPGCMYAMSFADVYRIAGAKQQARFARNYPSAIDAELTVLRVNNIVLATNPGELFNELGRQIKTESPYDHTFILSVTNGRIGYIPTREAAEVALELPLEDFVDPVKYRKLYGATITTEVGPDAGEMVVAETLHLIKKS
jgi:hypothetical protein